MKNTESLFQFEFSKTENQRMFLFFKTQQGAKIMDIVLENLRHMGIDYSINKKAPNLIEQEMIEKNTAKNESKLLPKIEVLDSNNNDDKKNEENLEEPKENKIDDEDNNKENLDTNNNEENNENK